MEGMIGELQLWELEGTSTAGGWTKADILIESIYEEETAATADSFQFTEATQADGGDEDGSIIWELGEGALIEDQGRAPVDLIATAELDTDLDTAAETTPLVDFFEL